MKGVWWLRPQPGGFPLHPVLTRVATAIHTQCCSSNPALSAIRLDAERHSAVEMTQLSALHLNSAHALESIEQCR